MLWFSPYACHQHFQVLQFIYLLLVLYIVSISLYATIIHKCFNPLLTSGPHVLRFSLFCWYPLVVHFNLYAWYSIFLCFNPHVCYNSWPMSQSVCLLYPTNCFNPYYCVNPISLCLNVPIILYVLIFLEVSIAYHVISNSMCQPL